MDFYSIHSFKFNLGLFFSLTFLNIVHTHRHFGCIWIMVSLSSFQLSLFVSSLSNFRCECMVSFFWFSNLKLNNILVQGEFTKIQQIDDFISLIVFSCRIIQRQQNLALWYGQIESVSNHFIKWIDHQHNIHNVNEH